MKRARPMFFARPLLAGGGSGRAIPGGLVSACLAGVLLLVSTGCLSQFKRGMILGQLKARTMVNWVALHRDPKVGDYAIHAGQGGYVVKYQIVSMTADRIHIRWSYVQVPDGDEDMESIEFHLFVDREGHTQSAYLYDVKERRKWPMRITARGRPGHLRPGAARRLAHSMTVHTPKGPRTVSHARIVHVKRPTATDRRAVFLQLHLLDPAVKFQIVRVVIQGRFQSRAIGTNSITIKNLEVTSKMDLIDSGTAPP